MASGQVNGIFEMRVTNEEGKIEAWLIEMKKVCRIVITSGQRRQR